MKRMRKSISGIFVACNPIDTESSGLVYEVGDEVTEVGHVYICSIGKITVHLSGRSHRPV